MSTSVLDTSGFWSDLLERAGRQAAQTVLPIVVAVGAAGSMNVKAVVIAVLSAVVLTLLKALAGIAAEPGEPWYWQLLDRAVPAAAGTALGFIPVDTFDVTAVDWSAVAFAAGAAAVIAVLAWYVTPPAASVRAELASSRGEVSNGDGPLEPNEVL